MKKPMETLIGALCLFVLTEISYGQQVEAPAYKDGDWWRVKVELSLEPGAASRSGFCHEMFEEYIVKVDQSKPKVYGVKGETQEEIDCPPIATQLFGSGTEADEDEAEGNGGTQIGYGLKLEYLKFPLKVGQSWTSRIAERRRTMRGMQTRWIDLEYKVLAWEKVSTPKGEFEVFKSEVSGWPNQVRTYYYSPKAKAIVRFDRKAPRRSRTVTVVDFNVSQ